VSGEKEDAFAARIGALEVFKAVINDDAGNIFASVTREEANFGKLAPERNELPAKQAASLVLGHFRKRKSQIAQTHTAQAAIDRIDG
jgi:hypothetical protein